MNRKKIISAFLIILSITFGYCLYTAIPVREFQQTDYLVIANNFSFDIYSNKYPVEQLPVRGKINEIGSLVGYTDDGIYVSALYGNVRAFEKKLNYYLVRYILKNGSLVIAEVIDLDIPTSGHQMDFPDMLYIDPPHLYYFIQHSKKFIKYNIRTHEKETLVTIDDCRYMYEFDGKYIRYGSENYSMVISKIENYKEIKVGEFTTVSLIPGSDTLLIYEEDTGNYYYDIETKNKKNIKNIEIVSWEEAVDSGNKIVYSKFHTSPLRLLLTIHDKGELWYYDLWLIDIASGEKELIYQLFGTSISYMVINLNDYPAFRSENLAAPRPMP